jgi:molecular chaperone DnaK
VYQTENLLKEQGDKVSPDERSKIDDALKRLKDALAGADIDAVRSAHDGLIGASQEFSQRLYQSVQAEQQAAASNASSDSGSTPSDDEVADAEIVDDERSA